MCVEYGLFPRSIQYSAVDGGIHDEFGDVTHLDSRYRCRNNLFILYNKALKYYSINSLSNWKSRVSRTTFILQYHSPKLCLFLTQNQRKCCTSRVIFAQLVEIFASCSVKLPRHRAPSNQFSSERPPFLLR